MTFQMIVLWTAVLIFIATLGFFGYSIYVSQYNISWPPSISDCPDYWKVSSDGLKCNYNGYNKCLTANEITTPTSFVISAYPSLCDKYDYASKTTCQPSFNWSGVSNSLKCKK
jgi:hypothetical protein